MEKASFKLLVTLRSEVDEATAAAATTTYEDTHSRCHYNVSGREHYFADKNKKGFLINIIVTG